MSTSRTIPNSDVAMDVVAAVVVVVVVAVVVGSVVAVEYWVDDGVLSCGTRRSTNPSLLLLLEKEGEETDDDVLVPLPICSFTN